MTCRRKNTLFICGGDFTPGKRDDCPNALHNWPLPSGYADASERATSRLGRGWSNRKCPDCGMYGWVPGRINENDTEVLSGEEA